MIEYSGLRFSGLELGVSINPNSKLENHKLLHLITPNWKLLIEPCLLLWQQI